MFKLWKTSLLLVLITLVGCSDPGPLRHPVQGTLMLDGKPLAYKSLTFFPADGTTGHGAAGFTNGEGKFYLQAMVPGAVRDYRGCPPGKYRVVVSEPLIPITGSTSEANIQGEVIDDNGPAAAVAMFEPTRRRAVKGGIPLIYASDRTTPLIVEVAEGMETYELALASK